MELRNINRLVSAVLVVFVLFSVTSSEAWGEANPELTRFVHEQVRGLQNSLADSPQSGESDFELRRFFIRLQAKFGIDIPIFAKFEIVPEVELVVLKSAL